jgi:hypothetical protein
MFYFRFKPLIGLAMMASLFVAQFSHVPHVHAGPSAKDRLEHDSRAHVHVGHSVKGKHGHSHDAKNSHTHPHQNKKKSATKSGNLTVELSIDHDNDAFYLHISPTSHAVCSATRVNLPQKADYHLSDYRDEGYPNQTFDYGSPVRPPDKSRPCPIYLIHLSIRC